jgi:hypothetical protein
MSLKRNVILWIAVMGFVSACSSNQTENSQTARKTPNCVLLFLDKSESMEWQNAFLQTKIKPILESVVRDNLQGENDRLEVWLIHENSSKAKALQLLVRTQLPDLEGLSGTDLEFVKETYKDDLKREQDIFLNQINQKFFAQNNTSSRAFTDIQATLKVIEDLSKEGYAPQVFYFSDMLESVAQADRRDFHRKRPLTEAEAHTWADADSEVLKDRYASLSKANITMVLPFEPTASSAQNNPAVTEYWKRFFENLGVSQIQEK